MGNFRVFPPYSTKLAVCYIRLRVEVRANYLENYIFGYFYRILLNSQQATIAYSYVARHGCA